MKKITTVLGIIVCAVVVSVNVMVTSQKEGHSSDLSLIQISAMAGGDEKSSESESSSGDEDDAVYGGWSNLWQGQGFWKDEKELTRPCPEQTTTTEGISVPTEGGTITIGTTHSQTNGPDRFEIICGTGKNNCTSVEC